MSNAAGSTAERLKNSVLNVTRDRARQRKAEERHASALANRRKRLVRASDYYNFKSAAYEVMERAYMAASANGRLPTSARQIMYQARPFVQEKMGGQPLNDQYFTQTLLPNYIEEHHANWDVTYDDRGHFTEPHTKYSIGLGTISVRDYVDSIVAPNIEQPSLASGSITTRGPDGCFGGVLFTEKEGFTPLFEAIHLAERFDIAIMSPKGMSSTAARTLIDRMCKYQVPLLVLHDFDKAGFSIIGTLRRDTRRFVFGNQTEIIDLGLRLADVHALNLEPKAEAAFDRGRNSAKRENLRLNGATPEEVEFLLDRRVELNAMTSDQLVAFVERKLMRHGIKKIVPNKEKLVKAYHLFARGVEIERIILAELDKLDGTAEVPVPRDLTKRVREYLAQNPTVRWDAAVQKVAQSP